MLHGAGIFTYIWAIFGVNAGKYYSTMEHLDMVLTYLHFTILKFPLIGCASNLGYDAGDATWHVKTCVASS